MICERCHAAEAVIHLTHVDPGAVTVRHYCVSCAQVHGVKAAAWPVANAQRPPDAPPDPPNR